jgi:hypothetical protein
MPLAGYFVARMSADAACALIVDGAERSGDPEFQPGSKRPYREEIRRLVDDSAERIETDERAKGLPKLAERFPLLARRLSSIWDKSIVLKPSRTIWTSPPGAPTRLPQLERPRGVPLSAVMSVRAS